MAEQLKNTLAFDLAPSTSVTIAHNLENAYGTPLAPDIIFVPSPEIEVVSSDELNITLRNIGGSSFAGSLLVESWHTIERAFGGVQNTSLPVKPYVVISADDQPPIPPFPPSQLDLTIYARTTGSDTTGNGSLANPYRTMQRAVRDVPMNIPPGTRYFVDITGISETLPPGYVLPAWKTPFLIDFYGGFDIGNAFFLFQAGVNIVADPKPIATMPLADTIINPGDVASITSDPLTAHIIITLNVPRASWTNANLQGRQLLSSLGGFENASIAAATTTTIELNHTFPPTLPLQLVEPSATLTVSTAPTESTAGLNANDIDSISFSGLRIVTSDGLYGLSSIGNGLLLAQMCELENPDLETNNQTTNRHVRTWTHGSLTAFGNNFSIVNSFLSGGALKSSDGGIGAPTCLNINRSTLDGCGPVEVRGFQPGQPFFPAAASIFTMSFTAIRNGLGDGIIFHGNVGRISGLDIAGCAGNGITLNKGAGVLNIHANPVFGVPGVSSSTPNGGSYGIEVQDGMQAIVDASVSGAAFPLKGTLATEVQVGNLASTTWAAVAAAPNNVPDYAGVDATGSRLSQQ